MLKLLLPPRDRPRTRSPRCGSPTATAASRLLRDDAARGALLLERLGPSLFDLGLPVAGGTRSSCATAQRVWRPAPGAGCPTGAEKGRWLIDYITRCGRSSTGPARSGRSRTRSPAPSGASPPTTTSARCSCTATSTSGTRSQAGDGFKLVDPDGLLAEAEYDLGILMREDPVELLKATRATARWLAARTGLDATAIWEWGVVERVSTGLLVHADRPPAGRRARCSRSRTGWPAMDPRFEGRARGGEQGRAPRVC